MDIHRLCAMTKERIAAGLRENIDPVARNELLIDALYELSRRVLPLLGAPRKSRDYLDGQGAVLELIGFLALALIKGELPDVRGVAVLSELGEGCVDPVLRRKLVVYAQELLARTRSAAAKPAPSGRPLGRWCCSLLVLLLALYCLRTFAGPSTSPGAPVLTTPAPVVPQFPADQASGSTGEGGASAVTSADRITVGRYPARPATRGEAAERDGGTPGEQTTRVRIVNNQVLVPVIVKNCGETARLELVLDTGASRTMIHDAPAARLKIDLDTAGSSQSEVADGRVILLHTAKVDLLSVGPFVLPAVELQVIAYSGKEGGRDGLLGMDFLGKHRYQIDMEHELIRWF